MRIYVFALLCAFAALGIATLASSSDPLDPGQLGESMSMPLPLELVQKAKEAGVITDSSLANSIYSDGTVNIGSGTAQDKAIAESAGVITNPGPVDSSAGTSTGSSAADATGSANSPASAQSASSQAINATGTWSLDLRDTADRHMDLSLFQNGAVILGYGSMSSENETQGVTVSGSVEESGLNLSVTTLNTLDLYRLKLTTSGKSVSGNYNAYAAGGETWSGTVTGTAPASGSGSSTASSSGDVTNSSNNAGAATNASASGTAQMTASGGAGPVDQTAGQSAASLGSGASTSGSSVGSSTGTSTGTSTGSSAAVGAGSVPGSSYSSSTYAGAPGSAISSSSVGSGSSSQSIQIGTGSAGSYSSMTSMSSSVYG